MADLKTADQEEQIVVFQLLNQVYGIDINSVLEIIRMEDITKIPQSPAFVEGVINLRGRIIPVIDLCKRFGLAQNDCTDSSRIIIVEVSGQTVGMIVDAVQEVLRISVSAIEPPPPVIGGIDAAYLRGIVILNERLIIMLNQNKILDAEETEQLNHVGL